MSVQTLSSAARTEHTGVEPRRICGWSIPLSLRLTAAMVALIAGTLLLTTSLNFVKFRRSLEGLADTRFVLVLGELGHAIESSIAVGVPLNGLDNVQYLLDQQQQRDPTIQSIDVADPRGRILFSSIAGRAGLTLPLQWDLHSADATILRDLAPGVVTLGQPLVNAFNEAQGIVLLRYSTKTYETTESAVRHTLAYQASILALFFVLVAWLGFRFLLRGFRGSVRHMSLTLEAVLNGTAPDHWRATNAVERHFAGLIQLLNGEPTRALKPVEAGQQACEEPVTHGRVIVRRMFGLAGLVLVLPLAVLGLRATNAFERALVPEMNQKAAALARAVSADLEHALQVGIPLDQLVQPLPYLDEQLTLVPEARYIAIERQPNEILYAVGLNPDQVRNNLAASEPKAGPPAGGWVLSETQTFQI